MNITKAQKIAFYRTGLKLINTHFPNLESYLEQYLLMRKLKFKPEECTPEQLIPLVPKQNLTPRSEIKIEGHWAKLKIEFEDKLAELEVEQSVIRRPTVKIPPRIVDKQDDL